MGFRDAEASWLGRPERTPGPTGDAHRSDARSESERQEGERGSSCGLSKGLQESLQAKNAPLEGRALQQKHPGGMARPTIGILIYYIR